MRGIQEHDTDSSDRPAVTARPGAGLAATQEGLECRNSLTAISDPRQRHLAAPVRVRGTRVIEGRFFYKRYAGRIQFRGPKKRALSAMD